MNRSNPKFRAFVCILGILLSNILTGAIPAAADETCNCGPSEPRKPSWLERIFSGASSEKYLLPSAIVPSDDPRIVELAHKITEKAKDDLQKASLIHHWLVTNIKYNDNVLEDPRQFSESLDAMTVLERRSGICVGISSLAAALLRAVGVPTQIIQGFASGVTKSPEELKRRYEQWDRSANFDAGGHVWNKVYINGKWRVLDATFDLSADKANPSRQYFLPSDDFLKRSHIELTVYDY